MILRRAYVLAATVGLVTCVSWLGHWSRESAQSIGCALDGVRVERLYWVRIVDGQRHSRHFCSVRCAERWLNDKPASDHQTRQIYVVDELSGVELPAEKAWFASTPFVSSRKVRVFHSRQDAEHACSLGGQVLSGAKRPFTAHTSNPHPPKEGAEKSTARDRDKSDGADLAPMSVRQLFPFFASS